MVQATLAVDAAEGFLEEEALRTSCPIKTTSIICTGTLFSKLFHEAPCEVGWARTIMPVSRRGERGSERLQALPEVTQLRSVELGSEVRLCASPPSAWSTTSGRGREGAR